MGIKDNPGGTIAHGAFSGGTSPIKVQSASLGIRGSAWYNAGPGNMFLGTDAVTTGNTIPIPVGKGFAFDDSGAEVWAVWDQAGCDGRFIRELAP